MIVAPRAVRPALHDETALVAARWDGATVADLAARFGMPVYAVTAALRRADFPLASAVQIRELPDELRERYRQGATPLSNPRDLEAFRRYLRDRGLSSGTATVYASNARVCLNAGVTDPDDVDSVFPDHASATRRIYRSALRWWASFVRATA